MTDDELQKRLDKLQRKVNDIAMMILLAFLYGCLWVALIMNEKGQR